MQYVYLSIGREFIKVVLKFLVILHVIIIVIISLHNNKMQNDKLNDLSGFQSDFHCQ